MKTALVVGASGLIGKHLTNKLLKSNYYEKVSVIVRKPLNYHSSKTRPNRDEF